MAPNTSGPPGMPGSQDLKGLANISQSIQIPQSWANLPAPDPTFLPLSYSVLHIKALASGNFFVNELNCQPLRALLTMPQFIVGCN
jgi:hypothetical protein